MKKVYKEKQILINQSGAAETGQLLAIMGPTGCGKTSLLNILAGRCPGNSQNVVRLSGDVFINGIKRDDAKFRGISAYVLQDDYLYPHLTVSETFALAASFYLPASNTAAMRSEFVDAIIAELGLNKARDTIIGDEKIRGVSGGERRRASIGVQLICDPAVLFLDEVRIYSSFQLPYSSTSSNSYTIEIADKWSRFISGIVCDGVHEKHE